MVRAPSPLARPPVRRGDRVRRLCWLTHRHGLINYSVHRTGCYITRNTTTAYGKSGATRFVDVDDRGGGSGSGSNSGGLRRYVCMYVDV